MHATEDCQPDRLSQIQTNWEQVFAACHESRETGGNVSDAQQQLLLRYAGAIYRYLTAVAGSEDVADDLAQEFALRFIRGDFRNARPERGRFRDFVKRSLVNLVIDSHRRKRQQASLDSNDETVWRVDQSIDHFAIFEKGWRADILQKTWQRYFENESERASAEILKLRATHPQLSSSELAKHASSRLSQEFSAESIRQSLVRGRRRFAELLRVEVAHSLGNPSAEEVDQEMSALGLKKYTI